MDDFYTATIVMVSSQADMVTSTIEKMKKFCHTPARKDVFAKKRMIIVSTTAPSKEFDLSNVYWFIAPGEIDWKNGQISLLDGMKKVVTIKAARTLIYDFKPESTDIKLTPFEIGDDSKGVYRIKEVVVKKDKQSAFAGAYVVNDINNADDDILAEILNIPKEELKKEEELKTEE